MSKSFESVFSPHKFTPSIIENNLDFDNLWHSNQELALSSLSHIAYFHEPRIRSFMKQLGATDTEFYDENGAQAFLSIWDNKAVLAFRGTQPIEGVGKHHHKLGFSVNFALSISGISLLIHFHLFILITISWLI